MKVRSGFVSNSSSSSFICIVPGDEEHSKIVSYFRENPNPVFPLEGGHKVFGRAFLEFVSWKSKLNFVFVQAIDALCENGDTHYWKMFLGYLQSVGVPEDSVYVYQNRWYDPNTDVVNLIAEHDDYGIDHESSVANGYCLEIFESPDSLKHFIEGEHSVLTMGDNDEEAPERIPVVVDE